MINNNAMIQVLLEHLAKSSEPFLLTINKRTMDYHRRDISDEEVFYSDKDEAVARLFDLCELYGWQLTRVDVSYDPCSTFIVKYQVILDRNEEMPYENYGRQIQ